MNTRINLIIILAALTGCGKSSKSDSATTTQKQQPDLTTVIPTQAAGTLALDVEGAVALTITAALTGGSTSGTVDNAASGTMTAGSIAALLDDSSSNLQRVNADGTFSSAFKGENPKAAVSHVMVKGDRIFVLFASPIDLIPGGVDQTAFDPSKGHVCWDGSVLPHDGQGHHCPDKPLCLLAVAKLSDGVMSCVDSDISYMPWDSDSNPVIQVDDALNIYYTGYNHATPLFRKLDAAGKKTDVVGGAYDFLVQPSGDLFFVTRDSNRLEGVLGGKAKHISAISAGFIAAFPDGNVYVDQTTDYALGETLVQVEADGALSPKPYLAPAGTDAMFAASGKCIASGHNTMVTADKKFFAMSQGNETCASSIIQYYPEYKVTPIKSLKEWQGGSGSLMKFGQNGTKMVVGGVDDHKVNKLIAIDPDTGVETNLLPNDEVKLSAVSVKGNKVSFSGKKISNAALVDNDGLMLLDDSVAAGTEIFGSVDLLSGQVTVAPSTVSVSEIQSL